MPDGTLQRRHGKAFERVAEEYERHRPTYPQQLVDLACHYAGLQRGDRVLEIGCGTGQLTQGLLTRGLRVTAVEPGERLVSLAHQRLQSLGELKIVNARFEDARLPQAHFRAVFSASAIHWIDPDVGWRRVADALVPEGTLALIQYFGLREPRSAEDQQTLLGAMTQITPEIAAGWPRYRDLETTLAGARARRENISEAWAWLGDHDVGRGYVSHLFDDAQIVAEPRLMEHTAAELNSLLGTLSFWSRLSPEQRAAIESANQMLYEQLGRPIRSGVAACLVMARRLGRRVVRAGAVTSRPGRRVSPGHQSRSSG